MQPWPRQSEVPKFYGQNVKVTKGVAGPDPKWERENLVFVPLPWKGVAHWNPDLRVKALRVHKRVAPSLTRILAKIWEAYGKNQKAIEKVNLHLIGGGYVWRTMRNKSRLSMHAYGCAVDLDPANNDLGDPTPQMPAVVVAAFEEEGWEWGGRWSVQNRDGMHFQAAKV